MLRKIAFVSIYRISLWTNSISLMVLAESYKQIYGRYTYTYLRKWNAHHEYET